MAFHPYTSNKHAAGDMALLLAGAPRTPRTARDQERGPYQGSMLLPPVRGGEGEQVPGRRVAAYRCYLEVAPIPQCAQSESLAEFQRRYDAWWDCLLAIANYATQADELKCTKCHGHGELDGESCKPCRGTGTVANWIRDKHHAATYKRWGEQMRGLGLIADPEPPPATVRRTGMVDAETGDELDVVTLAIRDGDGDGDGKPLVLELPAVTFGERLRYRRKERGLSQARLGASLAPPVTQVAVLKWEQGLKIPTEDRIFQLCHVLGVPPRILIGP